MWQREIIFYSNCTKNVRYYSSKHGECPLEAKFFCRDLLSFNRWPIIWYYGQLNRPTLAYFYHRTKYNFSISALKPVQLSLVGPEDAPRLHQKRNQSPRGAKKGCNMRGSGCPNFVPMQILILSRDKKFEKCPVFSLSPFSFIWGRCSKSFNSIGLYFL